MLSAPVLGAREADAEADKQADALADRDREADKADAAALAAEAKLAAADEAAEEAAAAALRAPLHLPSRGWPLLAFIILAVLSCVSGYVLGVKLLPRDTVSSWLASVLAACFLAVLGCLWNFTVLQAVKDKVAVGRAQRAFRASRVAAESSARRDARFERRFASSERKGAALDRKLDANFAAVNRGMAGGFKAVCRNQADAGAALCDLAAVAAARAPCSTLAKICLRASLMNPEQIAAALAKSPVASKYVVSGQPLYGVTGGEVRLLLEDGALGAWGIAAEDIIEVQVALVWVLACCTMNANGVVVCTGAYG